MVETTTATATTATESLLIMPMQVPSDPTHNFTTSPQESINSPDLAMPPFTPGQCLFCPSSSSSFTDSVIHMQRSHGLFVPYKQHLVVDLETLFKYLHLVIYGYRECIHCGTERATVQAVQQHMTGKGHCTFDISTQHSEFADFYDFSEPEDDDPKSDIGGEVESDERNIERTGESSNRKPILADVDSIRLPSGKIISKQSQIHSEPSFRQLRHRTRMLASQLEDSRSDPDAENLASKEEINLDIPQSQISTKREKRERAIVAHQSQNMSANDRNGLAHLSPSEQRSVLAVQSRQAEKVQSEWRRRQGKIDRKGNKNLYAYWHTETPVYQCG